MIWIWALILKQLVHWIGMRIMRYKLHFFQSTASDLDSSGISIGVFTYTPIRHLSDMFCTEPSIFSYCLLPYMQSFCIYWWGPGSGCSKLQSPSSEKMIPRIQHEWIRSHFWVSATTHLNAFQSRSFNRSKDPQQNRPLESPMSRDMVFQPPALSRVQLLAETSIDLASCPLPIADHSWPNISCDKKKHDRLQTIGRDEWISHHKEAYNSRKQHHR